mmetsp:Transcript_22657/g.55935  ORF Transcript_22657/g.55935 Transcript_22657/m.55935 type:complete len:228 (-) Transcript_22657:473-1156(-)
MSWTPWRPRASLSSAGHAPTWPWGATCRGEAWAFRTGSTASPRTTSSPRASCSPTARAWSRAAKATRTSSGPCAAGARGTGGSSPRTISRRTPSPTCRCLRASAWRTRTSRSSWCGWQTKWPMEASSRATCIAPSRGGWGTRRVRARCSHTSRGKASPMARSSSAVCCCPASPCPTPTSPSRSSRARTGKTRRTGKRGSCTSAWTALQQRQTPRPPSRRPRKSFWRS